MEVLLSEIKSSKLLTSVAECRKQIKPILQKYLTNFPDYTDHSIDHSLKVIEYIENLLGEEVNKLNEDEVYILIMAGLLHDIGMAPTNEIITEMKQANSELDGFTPNSRHQKNYY